MFLCRCIHCEVVATNKLINISITSHSYLVYVCGENTLANFRCQLNIVNYIVTIQNSSSPELIHLT